MLTYFYTLKQVAMNALEMALCGDFWSTDYTRLVLLVAYEIHRKRGAVRRDEFEARLQLGEAQR